MNRLFAYLPCYNEEKNIAELSFLWESEREQLRKEGYDLWLCAIDDKSTDKTLEVIRGLQKRLENYTVIAHSKNQGLGGALHTGIEHFLHYGKEGDICAFMDGDNTHKPLYVHKMLEKLRNGTECVIASRYRKGSKILGLAYHRLLLSDFARAYYTIIFHIPQVRDYTCGYRIYSYRCLKHGAEQFGEQFITQRSFSCMMELLYKLYLSGCQFDEIPFVLHYDNKKGESKMTVFRTVKDSLLTAIRLRFNLS